MIARKLIFKINTAQIKCVDVTFIGDVFFQLKNCLKLHRGISDFSSGLISFRVATIINT